MDFFKSHPSDIRPLLPWLRQELKVLYKDQWCELAAAEGTMLPYLCLCGLDKEVLVWELQGCLQEHTGTFFLRLITAATHLCGRDICWHLGQQDPCAAGGKDNGSVASPSPTASLGGSPTPHLVPPAALQALTWRSNPACRRPPSTGVPDTPRLYLSPQSSSSPWRSQGRWWRQVPLPKAAAATLRSWLGHGPLI